MGESQNQVATDDSPVALWTRSQRRALALILSIAEVWLAVLLWMRPATVADPQPAQGARFADLVDRLDPNVADVAALSAIPMLGPSRAQAIVEFRSRWQKDFAGEPAFRKPQDLMRVKGIGVALSEAAAPYLMFPPTPATAASTRTR